MSWHINGNVEVYFMSTLITMFQKL